ncbi:MAG: S-methyl-5-thioribose kinase [Candidatus Nanopelagicales bacterium]
MEYKILTVEEIPEYLVHRSHFSPHGAKLDLGEIASIEEIGDGNLNLVFIVRAQSGAGVVLKQSLPYVRLVGPEWPMTPERARIEATTTNIHAQVAPDLVPLVYDFDPERYIIAMEDLSDHVVWRTALNNGQHFVGVAADMGEYVAKVAFGTSIFSVDTETMALRKQHAQNPDLCSITEDLVFTEPYGESDRNSYLDANAPDAAAIAQDTELKTEIAMAKWIFMTHSEALIHGDLHTGSVMVRVGEGNKTESSKAFDSEFAFYGPVSFDLGALWANYSIAAARAFALGEDDRAHKCLALPGETWHAFEAEFRRLWPQRTDKRIYSDDFLECLLAQWREETWLFASAKMIRRIIGLAKTSDIETLEPNVREGAARGILQLGQTATKARRAGSAPDLFSELASAVLIGARTL